MKKLLFLFAVLISQFQSYAQIDHVDLKKLGPEVQKIVQQVYQASVSIALYNANTGVATAGLFSGVVIDTAGHVLSVAHAVKSGTLYQITFPDGTKKLARGMGTIATDDAAMLKITEKGTWPYAPMGWSSSLKTGMPCISISYPGTLAVKTPTVRFGYIAELKNANGYLRSTCLIEPGDSGGPLFDMKGRVIGLHSRVDLSLDANFEVPVDDYRKYWNAITRTETYPALPAENAFEADPEPGQLKILSGIEDLKKAFDKSLNNKMTKTVFKIKSPYQNKAIKATILGTLIKMDGIIQGSNIKGKSFLISKSSMVGDDVTVELDSNQIIPAKVIARDGNSDLVLLQVDRKLKGGVALNTFADDVLDVNKLGKLLVSPQLNGNPKTSVIGNTIVEIPRIPGIGSIGLVPKVTNGKVVVGQLTPFGSAGSSSILTGDELLSVNGKPIHEVQDLNYVIDGYTLKDTVTLKLSRGGAPLEKRVPVVIQPAQLQLHLAQQFTDGRSLRYSGFKKVIVHDGRLKPLECGGPLFGVDGTFYGINIARLSRTTTLAIPATELLVFIKNSIKN